MVQQQNMRSIWRSRKASGGTFPHLRDERQNQKDRMYKSESRGEGEREQSMAQPVKLKQLHYVMKGLPEPKILVCIQYMYS